jgi:hypothetical protein
MNTRAQIADYWLEYVAGAVLLLAFYLAARGAYLGVVYATVFITGALLGKFWYDAIRKNRNVLYMALLTMAVLLGMILGSIGADRRWVVILFFAAIAITYAAFAEKWLKPT